MELRNKSIIITAASSGVGAAAARLFGNEEAGLVLGARRSAEFKAVAGQVNDAGGTAVASAGDVRDLTCAKALVDCATKEYGGLDDAFNNAGIVGEMTPVPDMAPETWSDVVSVNLTGAFSAAKALIPVLQGRGCGSIVFTSTFVGFSNGGLPGMGAYAASNSGLIGLVRSLASDHAAGGVWINALLPGGTITPSGGEGEPATPDYGARLHPMNRMASAEEIAQAALFLLWDRSSLVTGSPMLVVAAYPSGSSRERPLAEPPRRLSGEKQGWAADPVAASAAPCTGLGAAALPARVPRATAHPCPTARPASTSRPRSPR